MQVMTEKATESKSLPKLHRKFHILKHLKLVKQNSIQKFQFYLLPSFCSSFYAWPQISSTHQESVQPDVVSTRVSLGKGSETI